MNEPPGSSSPCADLEHALWEYYSAFDGLAGMQVEEILQDRRGYLWIATADGGVSRFDGAHFDNLTPAEGLPHLTVMGLAETPDGRLWFGTLGGGLAAYDGRRFEVFTTTCGLPSDDILRVRAEPDASLLVMTRNGMARFRDGRCWEVTTHVGGEPIGPVLDALTDRFGRTWMATRGRGVVSTDGRSLDERSPQTRLPPETWRLAHDARGHIWVGTRYRGSFVQVFRYDPVAEHLERFATPPGMQTRPAEIGVRDIRIGADGWLWLSHRGVTRFDGSRWQRVNLRQHGLDLTDVRLTYEDREGNLWIGLWGGGLAFCDPVSQQRFTEADGLPDAAVKSLAEDGDGRIWIGTFAGLACLERGTLGPAPASQAWSRSAMVTLCSDGKGRVWAGDEHGTIYRWDGCVLESWDPGLQAGEVTALCPGRDGTLWIGYSQGTVLQMVEGRRQPVVVVERPPQALLEDRQGVLWIGMLVWQPPLLRYDGQRVVQIGQRELGHKTFHVSAFCQTDDGTLWIGTSTGLVACREGCFQHFSTADGLSDNAVLSLAPVPGGGLWIGTTGGGAVRYDGNAFRVVRLGRGPAENVVGAVLVDREGRTWFGTRAGLVRYAPNRTPPQVVIRQVMAGVLHREPEAVTCPETVPEVRIQFQGLGFRSGAGQMLYTYRLVGGKAEWSPPARTNEAVYVRLPAGRYRFEVRAMDRDGLVSETAGLDLVVTADTRMDRIGSLEHVLRAVSGERTFVGQSAALQACLQQVAAAAEVDVTVLILGETGTGKGLIARSIHEMGPRRRKPFIHVGCGALPSTLIASELFGHEKGAFTGASERRMGRIELAEGGTLFLDEIGDLPLDLQGHLLQVLEEKQIQRVGGGESIRVDVRVLAATNRDLQEMVRQGHFRADLYFRLNGFVVHTPPLRERREDIALLLRYFAERFARHLNRPVPQVQPEVLERLQEYAWPGNIRELEHLVQRAVVVCRGGAIAVEDMAIPTASLPVAPAAAIASALSLNEHEKRLIEQALRQARGVIYGDQGAARLLGLNPEKLRVRMRKHGLQRADFR
ncbi:MAG: sigma 54-interacting transcriptional regulator [Candidatus Latescibacterota bacterium]